MATREAALGRSMDTVRYRGCRIAPLPYQLHRSGRWTVDLEVWRGSRRVPYALREFYATEREATKRCVQVGQRIVDGRMPGVALPWPQPSRGREVARVAGRITVIGLLALALLAFLQGPLPRL